MSIHPSGIKQSIVDKVYARRGRLHAFPTMDPAKTALVVVNLDAGTVERVADEIRPMVPRINKLAAELRAHGGTVAWITMPVAKASPNFRAVLGNVQADLYEKEAKDGRGFAVWPELDVREATM
jgi:ureidoacrylate peracid hydrolase